MNPQHWQKVKNIIEQALEVAPEMRSSYLAEACGEDQDLRREVDSLLTFEEETFDLIERGVFSAVLDGEPNKKEMIGKRIGHYKIVAPLGEGGMGTVYLAERADGAFEQQAALKLIKPGMDSNAILRRFLTERQILASLKHSNIAHLIDGGTTEEGLPYFVIEYVAGETITDYAERENLDLEGRLKLFLKVCAAVSFAHSNLVIHRDLKPSNILVNRDGEPKLLDFGIAKLLKSDANGQTATQSFVFTPEYASPEQVRGEKLTTASDVYSLGVILYELLTGRRPYKIDSRNIGEIIRAICETEPGRPSSVVGNLTDQNGGKQTKDGGRQTNPKSEIRNWKSLRGDLDNIILKALRKEPERRYSSVEQFSEDVRRHLEGLPVAASSDTWKYRATKFVQRNRVAVVAAGLVLLTLIGGLAATYYQARIARAERAKAEQRFKDVRQLANSFLFEFYDTIEPLSGSTPARKLVVSRAVEYLDILASEAANDSTLQRELGTAYERLGKIQGNSYFSNLGDTKGAMKSYNRSLEIRQRLAEADPANRELQYELARSWRGVGDMLYTANDLKAGLEAYENGIAVLERIVAQEPDNLKYLNAFADTLTHQGDIKGMEGFQNLGDTKGALESYRQAVEIGEKIVAAEPDNAEYLGDYATRLIYFGKMQSVTGDYKGAILSGQKSISLFEKLSAADPDNAEYKTRMIIVSNSMLPLLLEEGRSREAFESAQSQIKKLEEMIAKDPKNVNLRRGLGVLYNTLGGAQLQLKDFTGAIEAYRRSLAIGTEISAADPKSGEARRDVLIARQLLAEAQIEAGEPDAALQNLRQNVSIYEEILKGSGSSNQTKDNLAVCLALIGRALAVKGDLKNSAETFRRAASTAEEVLQKSEPNNRSKSRSALSFFEAGKVLKKLGQIENGETGQSTRRDACGYFRRSFELWSQLQQTGVLSTVNANRPAEAAAELAGCGM